MLVVDVISSALMNTLMTIRERRIHLDLSLDELGLRCGIERSRLSRGERGYVTLDNEELGRIAKELGVSARRLRVPRAAGQ